MQNLNILDIVNTFIVYHSDYNILMDYEITPTLLFENDLGGKIHEKDPFINKLQFYDIYYTFISDLQKGKHTLSIIQNDIVIYQESCNIS